MKIIIVGYDSTGRGEISKIVAEKMKIPCHSYGETDIADEYYVLDMPQEVISKENGEARNIIKKQAGKDSIVVGLLYDREDEKLQALFKDLCDFVSYVKDKTPQDVANGILRDVKIILNFKGDSDK